MKVAEIAFSCYPVTDLRRTPRFYEEVLGLAQSRFFGTESQGFVAYDIGPRHRQHRPGLEAIAGRRIGGSISRPRSRSSGRADACFIWNLWSPRRLKPGWKFSHDSSKEITGSAEGKIAGITWIFEPESTSGLFQRRPESG